MKSHAYHDTYNAIYQANWQNFKSTNENSGFLSRVWPDHLLSISLLKFSVSPLSIHTITCTSYQVFLPGKVNPTVLFCFSMDAIHNMTKRRLERNAFISSYSLKSNMKRSQIRNLKTETGAETLEACCLLACTTQDHLPWDGISPSRRYPSTSIINRENPPLPFLQTIWQGHFHSSVAVFPNLPNLCQFDKILTNTPTNLARLICTISAFGSCPVVFPAPT